MHYYLFNFIVIKKIYIKALSLLFGCTEEQIGQYFTKIADELEEISKFNDEPKDNPYTGWRKEAVCKQIGAGKF